MRPTGCCYVDTFTKSYDRKKGSTRVHPQWAPAEEEEALLRREVTSLGEIPVLSCLKVGRACSQVPPLGTPGRGGGIGSGIGLEPTRELAIT